MENQVENWKDVIGYEGLYQISNLGNCKSIFRVVRSNSRKSNYTFKGKG